jgi:hypothetical protein
MFQLQPANGSNDPRGTLAINASPAQLITELRHIVEWLEAQA